MKPQAARASGTPAGLLAAVEDVREIVMTGADEAETTGTLPASTVAALRDSGLLAMKVPAALGGVETDVLTQIEVIEALAYIDGAAAWCVMVGATAVGWAGAFLADEAIAHVFAGSRVPTAAVAVQPTGAAIRTKGGYRLSGRWSFASGIRHSEWIVAGAMGRHHIDADAQIGLMLVFPKSAVSILNDWESIGLQGTGSCGFVVEDLFVPESFVWHFPHARPLRGGPLYRLGWPGFVAHEPGAFALGIARRALDQLVVIEQQRNRVTMPSLATTDTVLHALGHAELRMQSARALLREVFGRAWECVCMGAAPSPRMQAEMRGAAAFATEVAVDITGLGFRHGGSKAVYRPGVLQQCLRDVQAAAQHWLVRATAYGVYGQFVIEMPNADPIADGR